MSFFNNLYQFVFSKRFLVNLGLLVMVYLLIMIATIYYLDVKTNHGQKLEVKDYVGQNITQVERELEEMNVNYEVVDSVYDAKKPAGTILYQRPLPTSESKVYVKEGRKFYFRVTKNSKVVEIPLLMERSERYAIAVLKNMGIQYVIQQVPSTEAVGAVLDQRYKGKTMLENQKIPVNSTITLFVGVSVEAAEVQIPDLSCMTINQVKSRLQAYAGLQILDNYVNCATKEDSLNAKVVFQNPSYEENKLIQGNSTVTITLDKNGCN